MENKEFTFNGLKLNGFFMLLVEILVFAIGTALIVAGAVYENSLSSVPCIVLGIVLIIAFLFMLGGFIELEPNEARVMIFFGKYRGTFTQTGFFWVHPFLMAKKLSLRARN